MSGVLDEASTDDSGDWSGYVAGPENGLETGDEFPRFLNREQPEQPAQPSQTVPPPLPPVPWRRGVNLSRVAVAGTATFGVIAVASAALMTSVQAPSAAILSDTRDPLIELQKVADAVETVAQFETRVNFGANLSGRADAHAPTESALSSEPGPDPVAELLSRAMPEAVTVPFGANAGQGVWLGGDAENLSMSLGDGDREPILAETEVFSRTALMLADVQPPSSEDGQTARPEPARVVTGKPDAQNDEEATETVKTKPRVRVRKVKIAREEVRPVRRFQRGEDAYKARTRAPAANAEAPSVADAKEEDKPAGPISKFFAWLKGGPTKPAIEAENAPAFGVAPLE